MLPPSGEPLAEHMPVASDPVAAMVRIAGPQARRRRDRGIGRNDGRRLRTLGAVAEILP
jgi:hypothetical protein